jgi:hypothetical protein
MKSTKEKAQNRNGRAHKENAEREDLEAVMTIEEGKNLRSLY